MKLTDGWLQERITYHLDKAKAYQTVLADMNGQAVERKQDRLVPVLAKAIRLRQAVNGHGPRDAKMQERQAILQSFIHDTQDTAQPYRMTDFMKVLKAHGHVPSTKTLHTDLYALGVHSNGRVWSTAFQPRQTVAPPQTRKKKPAKRFSGTLKDVKARRKRSAKLLAKVEKAGSVPFSVIGQEGAVLLRHGYIKKQGDGYVRTDKAFTV